MMYSYPPAHPLCLPPTSIPLTFNPYPPHLQVRNWSHFNEVVQGKDYDAANSWVLRLPPEILRLSSGITVWIGKCGRSVCQIYHRELEPTK